MKARLLFLIFLFFSGFASTAQVLYRNNIPYGSAWPPGLGTGDNPIIMFDDINIASSIIGAADSIGITQVKFAIATAADAPGGTVKLFMTTIDPKVSTYDSLPAIPPKLVGTLELPPGDQSGIYVLGDSINPFYTLKADTGYLYNGYQTFFLGASFSNNVTGWALSTGPDFNEDAAFEYDSLDINDSRKVFWFGGTPRATFYAEVFGKMIAAASPVPVTLKDFSVAKRNNQNLLTWKTETENNSSHFIIERSKNGHEFKSIGQVAAAGMSTGILNYQFIDPSPLKGTNFYRLNNVDKDKKSKYSIIRSIRNFGETLLNIYPNPVINVLKADIDAARSGKGFVNIFDLTGKQVFSKHIDITEGVNSLSFNISNVSAGSYVLNVKIDDDIIVKRFTKR